MVNQDLGRVAVVLRGEYDPEAQYERLDCISYQGSSYLVRKHCAGITPAAGEYYQLAALAGSSAAADAAALLANEAAKNADAAAGRADAAAGNAQEAADAVSGEVNQIKDDLSAEQTARENAVNAMRADLTANANSDAVTKRSLDALWKLNQGISYQFETDDTEAYQKTVPSGAKLASVKKIGGKTVVWNQQVNPANLPATHTISGVTFINNADGSITVNGTAAADAAISGNFSVIAGHKYLYTAIRGSGSSDSFHAYITGDKIGSFAFDTGAGVIYTASASSSVWPVWCRVRSGTAVEQLTVIPQIYDLTRMFGAGSEPTSIDDFRSMFPADYYPYNPGALLSMPVNEIVNSKVDGTVINTMEIPESILTLDGYGDSVGDVFNYVDWESMEYHKRVGKVDMGSLAWTIISGENRFRCTWRGYKKPSDGHTPANILCAKYENVGAYNVNSTDQTIGAHPTLDMLCANDLSFNGDAAAFKAAMSGVMLYYELAEEEVIDISGLIADTFQEPFTVESGGTLTFKNPNGNGYCVPVPNTEEYIISLTEVNQ